MASDYIPKAGLLGPGPVGIGLVGGIRARSGELGGSVIRNHLIILPKFWG